MKISYDYSEFLQELKEELQIGTLDLSSDILIVRSDQTLIGNYQPIIDWYYSDDEPEEPTVSARVTDVYDEMEEMNTII